MKILLSVLLILHIVCGTAALICGAISMAVPKGKKWHNASGKVFFWTMTGVFLTATAIGLIKELWFLFFVGFFSYYMTCSGYRALSLKKLHIEGKPAFLDWLINGSGLLFGIGLLVLAGLQVRLGNPMGAIVPASLGGTSIVLSIGDIKRFYVRPRLKGHWLVSHGSRMGGAFAAAVTAFVVVNLDIGQWNWVLWILPGVLIGPLSARMVKKRVKA